MRDQMFGKEEAKTVILIFWLFLAMCLAGCGTATTTPGQFQKESTPSDLSETEQTQMKTTVAPTKIEGYEIFDIKDPFGPLTGPGSTTQVITTTTTTGTGTQTTSTNQVRLVSIPSGTTATIDVNGTDYENLRAGDTFAQTFKLLTIGTGSVTVLYGDNQYTLYLGETISVK